MHSTLKHGIYSHSWSTLIGLIQQHDKSYAFGLYSLLAETIDSTAYAYQLKADILYYFQDDSAYDQYEAAAIEYDIAGNSNAAIGIYDLLVEISNNPIYSTKRTMLLKKASMG